MKPIDISAIVQKILSALPGVAVSGGATSQTLGKLPACIWEVVSAVPATGAPRMGHAVDAAVNVHIYAPSRAESMRLCAEAVQLLEAAHALGPIVESSYVARCWVEAEPVLAGSHTLHSAHVTETRATVRIVARGSTSI